MFYIKYFICKEFVVLCLLMLVLINPYGQGIYSIFLFTLWFLNKTYLFKNYTDKRVLTLFAFSMTYSLFYLFDQKQGLLMGFIYAFFPASFYMIGKYFTLKYQSFTIYYFIITFIAVMLSIIPIISVFNSIIQNGFEGGGRNLTLIWSDGKEVAATRIGAYFTLNMAFAGTFFLRRGRIIEKNVFFVLLTIFLVSLICVIRLGSRTQLVIAAFSVIASLIYIAPRQSIKRNLFFLTFMFVCFTFMLDRVYFTDSEWMHYYTGRMESEEYGIGSAGGRTDKWLVSLRNLLKYPFGWKEESIGYSHNLWLDVSRVTGIIPFLILSIFSISNISLFFKSLKVVNNRYFFNGLVIAANSGFLLLFFVEPIIEGMFIMFMLYCLFNGFLSGYVKSFSNYDSSYKEYL